MEDFTIKQGESWWIVPPNYSKAEFKAPIGAAAFCKESFLCFTKDVVYYIADNSNDTGWITMQSKEHTVDMPYYLFVRYFDAQAFIRGTMDPVEQEEAKPFDYKSTIPPPRKRRPLEELLSPVIKKG